ncbi:GH92 family glycosyl hydrolase [Bacteroides sp. AF25-38AC]|uniref:GH92 family glycosyl hydrolase n=1 Tax=Bacteroides sp. AF25-38AC TaxID=2292924 RepID=UPI000E747A19|nr:GH92 family glycosyl hydrolase [Bacteroides sp. AF25-38AC]RJV33107.1 glycoside hydrolase family 92 protein [Bacteroides sp. AF25-38AC]
MVKYILFLFLLVVSWQANAQSHQLVDYVDPLMGTFSRMELSAGNTYPTVCVPFGMHNWAPHTGKIGDNFLYTYHNNFIYGFRQTHQASLWIGDYGQFSVMPVVRKDQFTQEGRKSWYSHKTEIAKPYYYSVYLGDHQANVEFAPTERAAKFRFTFQVVDSTYIVIDAFNKGSYVKIIPEQRKIIGYSTTSAGGTPKNFKNYFVFIFDKPFAECDVWSKEKLYENQLNINGEHVGAIVRFKLKKGEKIGVNVASSYIDLEQAELNLTREISKDSFEQVVDKAKERWENELQRIKVSGGTDSQYRTFYSCLYRTLIFPRKFYEINKKGEVVHYSPYKGRVLRGYMYSDNGFWDTFRAQFPLMNLLYPEIVSEVLQSMENIYKESGWLPEWFSPGHRDCMIGSHSASIIADAYLKGIKGFDMNLLYEAILKNTQGVGPVSSVGRLGATEYNTLGYIPYDVGINQNVSRTLEYAYDDFCIYQLSKMLKKPKRELEKYYKRSLSYRNLFDKETELMRPRNKSGEFLQNFNPFRWGDHFTEGNSWQYTWFVPHDVEGLMQLYGDRQQGLIKMDSVFILPQTYDISFYKRGIIHLIREMQAANMGQYAHLNEPMHHMSYMFNFGQPWRTQEIVRLIMDKLYAATPDGYCGDEDNGQMSAWYVFSAIGFYPLCPVTNEYVFGSPLFRKIEITLGNGEKVYIEAPNNCKEYIYIDDIQINNKPYSKNYFTYSDMKEGLKIKFRMASLPNKRRGIDPKDFPYSLTGKNN